MSAEDSIFIGASRNPDDSYQRPEQLLLRYGNRHGLITGATGTGKTVTLQVLAESFAQAGVPVFCADMKGDLSGIAAAGEAKDFLLKRAEEVRLENYTFEKAPVIFWDLFGEQGHPIRATVSEMGPLLLSRLMNLSEAQEGVLNIAFRIADEEGLLLLDLKDLQALLNYMAENAAQFSGRYGNITKPSVGAIQRSLLVLEQQGGDKFFGEPALQIADLMRTTRDGRGYVNVLAADKLMMKPKLYATFLLWLLSELFEELPEVGDPEKPRLVFFFDEAHLLFNGASKAFLTQVVQTVRLIRSKGVGVFFVTQSPKDVPADVLAQLGNRVQHALRAYTPDDAAALRAAARTFPRSDYDLERLLQELGTGEAVVTVLTEKGAPTPVAWTRMRAPQSSMDPAGEELLARTVNASPLAARYAKAVDNESAYEMLTARMSASQQEKQAAEEAARAAKEEAAAAKEAERRAREEARAAERARKERERAAKKAATTATKGVESLLRSVGTQLGREITRSIFGTRRR